MIARGEQDEAETPPQLRNFCEGQPLEGRFVLQRMERNALEQVAERQVKVFRQSLEHLEEPLFQPYAGLNAFDFARRGVRRGSFGGHGEFRVRGLAANDRRFAAGGGYSVRWAICAQRGPLPRGPSRRPPPKRKRPTRELPPLPRFPPPRAAVFPPRASPLRGPPAL